MSDDSIFATRLGLHQDNILGGPAVIILIVPCCNGLLSGLMALLLRSSSGWSLRRLDVTEAPPLMGY